VHIEDKDLITTLSQQLDGLPLLGAAYARVDTAMGFSRWLGPVGNYLLARPAARAEAHKIEDETEVPLDAAVVLGLTSAALHVWAADPMLSQVHDYLGDVPLDRITSMEAEAGKTWQQVTITVDTGQSFTLQARGDVHGLVAAFPGPGRQ